MLRCHASGYLKAPVINPEEHSHHFAGNAGDECISCHMPVTVYMQRHPRHDHGLTIPDPLLTKKFGIPNACNRCHADKTRVGRWQRWRNGMDQRWNVHSRTFRMDCAGAATGSIRTGAAVGHVDGRKKSSTGKQWRLACSINGWITRTWSMRCYAVLKAQIRWCVPLHPLIGATKCGIGDQCHRQDPRTSERSFAGCAHCCRVGLAERPGHQFDGREGTDTLSQH